MLQVGACPGLDLAHKEPHCLDLAWDASVQCISTREQLYYFTHHCFISIVMDGKKNLRRSPRLSSTALHGLEADSDMSDNPKGPAMSGLPTNSRYLYSQTVLGSHSTESTLTGSSQGLTNPSEKGQTSDSEVFTRMSYLAMENNRHISPANESRPSQKSVLRMILNIPCLLLMAFVSLPRYLVKACISSVELITLQNVKMIFKILLLLIPMISGFYCIDWFSSWRLREEEMSQLHGVEMKSYWKSYILLKQQFNEIEDLKKEMDLLRAELDNVKNGILHSVKQTLEENGIPVDNKDHVLEMINSQFKKIYEDDVQMPDWAQKTIGATIDASRTSKSYEPRNEEDSWFSLSFLSSANPPDTILQPDVSPGSCWAFPGSQGQVVIKLPEKIQPTAVTIQHISKAISPSGEVTSAPKDFAVYGLDEKTEILLGKFMYDLEKEVIQTFQLQMELPASFIYIKFSMLSNWGHSDYTCIYRVRVHGKMVSKS
ncbi:SUN domain-containing protein 3 isoform C [Alligator mississippiensis]|uniref:SUN domain-containing protein 3 isoform C n=1 Tax=Alligator mississippiensis TaxID=8496 RepID=A0A151NEG7_ALLMI|nr:SUN domain-containing protein 3 isoform C [Alligator mississippiensis]